LAPIFVCSHTITGSTMNFRLPKTERLHADKLIKELFNEGSSFFLYPFKVQFLIKKNGASGTRQVLFSVAKKKVKRAVGRNFIKRRMKEAYRLNKHLLSETDQDIAIGLIYVGSELMEFPEIQKKITLILKKLDGLIANLPTDNEETT